MMFGKYLVERGIISADQFYEALQTQLASRPQLGALAVEHRMLTMHQVFDVLKAQCDAPSVLFGDLAISLNFLTDDQVARLLREQSALMTPFEDVLVGLNILDRQDVIRHRREFASAVEQSMCAEMVLMPA